MPTPLRILILEDNPSDAELMLHELRKSDVDPIWQRVDDESGYLDALDPALDVILADYTLPQFDALRALHLLRDRELDVPFVVVTASISEEVAVECMKQGAADYLLKDRLVRLAPAVHGAIEARRLRQGKQAAEAALRESEARYRAVSELTSDFAYLARVGPDGTMSFEWVTDAVARITGLEPKEFVDRGWDSVIHPEDRDLLAEHIQRLGLGDNQGVEFRIVTRRGDVRLLRNYGRPVSDPADGLDVRVYGAAQDITARRRIVDMRIQLEREHAARAVAEDAQRRFKRIVESNIIGIIVCNEEQIVEANDVFLELVGYSREDLQAGIISWRAMTPPEYLPSAERQLLELRERGVYAAYEKEYVRKDGSPVPILLGGAVLDYSPLTWISFVVDLTERTKVERERELLLAREQAARIEAQEAMQHRSQLLAVVSHDLKNPLTWIKGYAQLVQRQFAGRAPPDRSSVLKGLRTIEETVTTMTRQINELVDGARLQIGETLLLERQPTDLVSLARQVVASTQLATDRHQILVHATMQELIGNWDPVRLERVLGNFLDNAIKYSPDGGDVLVTITDLAEDVGAWAVVAISDQGIGIPEAEREQIFERFHRGSNAVGRITGTGLGLSGARQIVEQHGGSIAVESQVGQGSTFIIRLPL